MFIQLIAVGKLKGDFVYLKAGIEDYLKRLQPYARVSLIEVPDEQIAPSKTREQILEKEAMRLRGYFEKAAYTVVLSEKGQLYDSITFSEELFQRNPFTNPLASNPTNGGTLPGSGGPMIVIIGGALGVSDTLIHQADWVLSLSPMTFPHPMVRLIFLEQLYRAFKIRRNEPYHK